MDRRGTGLKQIPGYKRYQVDIFGNIYNGFRYLKPGVKRGRYCIRLYADDGKRHEEAVHKLVAAAHISPDPGKVLYHKNGNRFDNCVNNLEYIDRKNLGRITGANAKRQPVIKIDDSGEIVEAYRSAREAARQNYMSYQTIIDRCNGKVKSRYAPDGYQYEWEECRA